MIISQLLKHNFTSTLIALLLTLQMSACTTEEFAATVTDAIDTGTITGPNINSTVVISGVDSGSVIEDVDPNGDNLLEVGGKLNITDSGTGDAAFITEAVSGDYGSLTIDAAGIWNYTADNNQAVIQNLTSSATLTDSLIVSSVNGITHAVVVTIMGADETNTPPPGTNNPALISGVDAGSVVEDNDPDNDNLLEVGGKLNVTDSDNGEAAFVAKTLNGNYGSLTIDAAGNWNYAANNGQSIIQNLVSGATLTDSLTVSSVDGTTHAVIITIMGADETNTPPPGTNQVAMYSYNANLSDAQPLSGAVLEQTTVYMFFNNTSQYSSMNFYCCKGIDGASTGEAHKAGVRDSSAPFVHSVDLSQYSTAGTRELYVDATRTDGNGLDNINVNFSINISIIPIIPVPINVSLSWVAPAEREDNTALSLSEIAKYKIYYSSTQGQYANNVVVNDSTATGHTFTNFSSGTYYFVITTIDTDGRESKYSPEVIKAI